MKYAVLTRTFSPPLTDSMTFERWVELNHPLDGCIEAREVQWLYSLISVQGDRSICLFQVPYTDAVREACRESRTAFQQLWQAELWMDVEASIVSQQKFLVVAEVNCDPPMTKDRYEFMKQQAKGCFQEMDVQPLLTAITLDGKQSVCLFMATSAEEVRSLYRKVGMPFEQVWKAMLIQPMP